MYFADLHVHSRFSRATSLDCNLVELARWAAMKGVRVLGTGDFTHPLWNQEIREMLVEVENKMFRLKTDFLPEDFQFLPEGFGPGDVRFILNVEISSIYKRDGRVRKVHSLIFVPDLESMDRLNSRLDRIGNIKSDGRPILGLDCRDLLEITLEASSESFLVPAHVWTPWFSALGSKSGFDSIEECFRDLAPHIFALETGLSSDPAMNFMVSSLDDYTLISNSDAHSPSKVGREANIFSGEPGYYSIREAIRAGGGGIPSFGGYDLAADIVKEASKSSRGSSKFLGTAEFFPEEGKYHLDGHRKCAARLEPSETEELGGRCPVCGQAVTVGVMNRVIRLADRPPGRVPERGAPFWRLLPLSEIVAQVLGVRPQSKRVEAAYTELLRRLGPELDILWSRPLDRIAQQAPPILVEAIERVRAGNVSIKAGYDGEYGTVQLFDPRERAQLAGQKDLFPSTETGTRKRSVPRFESLPRDNSRKRSNPETSPVKNNQLNNEQLEAVNIVGRAVIVKAGPGTGKTLTLTHRIQNLISTRLAKPQEITAVTFTRKAAQEIRDRLERLATPSEAYKCWAGTFHQLGTRFLDMFKSKGLFAPEWSFISEDESFQFFRKAMKDSNVRIDASRMAVLYKKISLLKQDLVPASDERIPSEASLPFLKYEELLSATKLLDLDDLIAVPVRLLRQYPAEAELLRSTWCRHLLVDEFQDLNRAQYEMVKLLAGSEADGLFAIGDPDQAIYGFRGANSEFFMRFSDDFPSSRLIGLFRNYRSQANIVAGAVAVIDDHKNEQHIVSENPGTSPVRIICLPNPQAEGKFIVSIIEKLLGGSSFLALDSGRVSSDSEQLGFRDFTVLFRLNSVGDALEEAFQASGIPVQRSKKIRPEDEADSLDLRAEAVNLMTIHASKGLEFPVVFIAACEDGIIPYIKPGDTGTASANIDEERRLLYVAMTRAQRHLFVTYSSKRNLFGQTRKNSISRFLSVADHSAFGFDSSVLEPIRQRGQNYKQGELFA